MHVPATQWRYACFGAFEVDVASHELLREGRKIKLQEMPFQILAMLLDRPGQVVTREEFRQKLWASDTFVDFEHSINTAVRKLREALEDDAAAPRYIETLPKVGYRLITAVEVASDPANGAAMRPPPSGGTEAQDVTRPGTWLRWYVFSPVIVVLAAVLMTAVNAGGSRDAIRQWWSGLRGFPKPIRSLAVLPLQNLSQNPDDDYFADGLTDALITDLGNVGGLRVISHTSVMAHKKAGKALPQIAGELDVDAIIEGTVLHSGDKLRVTVQLVRASPEEHVWAERYERDVGELIRLEKQLALAIAHEVTGHLTTAEETAVSSERTTNLKAYEAYMHGRYLWKDRTSKAASGAGAYFEQALREDPNFALAYSGLADYYTVSWGTWVNVPVGLTYARRAVELGPDLAETHASLGIALQYQCEFAEAGMELQRAVELNPNYATAHHWYAIHLAGMGRVQEALAENERARRLDPFSLPINFYRTGLLIGQRQFDQANEQIEILAALAPDAARRQRASLYWAQDRVPEAIAEEKLAAGFEAMPGSPPSYWDEVAQAYARGGKQAALLRAAQVRELACTNPSQVRGRGLHCDYGDIAISYEATGDKEKTLHWLKPAIKQARDSINGQCWVANTLETGYADLRSDPRFQEILRSLGLPE